MINNKKLTNSKLRIIHIHNDPKFIFKVNNYINPNIDNKIYYINKDDLIGDKFDIVNFEYSMRGAIQLIERCNTDSLVIIYGLDFIKSYIINRLPINVNVIWRLFGFELYGNISTQFYSNLTIDAISNNTNNKSKFGKIYSWLKFYRYWRTRARDEMNRARGRCDLVMTTTNHEYNFIKGIWPDIPPFLQVPYPKFVYEEDNKNIIKKNDIIVGNSRSPYNNHIDIIQIIQNVQLGTNISFTLFFNYGPENQYTDIVIKLVKQIDQIRLIEDFLPIEEFNQIYKEASALIINSYRQLAGNNIITAFQNGVKVYLNEKNVLYKAFLEKGFIISNINTLESDIKTNNYKLTDFEIMHNKKALVNFTKINNLENFHNFLLTRYKY